MAKKDNGISSRISVKTPEGEVTVPDPFDVKKQTQFSNVKVVLPKSEIPINPFEEQAKEQEEAVDDNVKLQNSIGEIVDVPKEDANSYIEIAGYKPLTEEQIKGLRLEKEFGSADQQALTALEGEFEGASFGLINKAESALADVFYAPNLTHEAQEARKLINPKSALTGNILGTGAMIFGTGGFGGAGASAAAKVGLGAEAAATKAAESVAATAIENGLNAKKVSELAAAARALELAKYSGISKIGARAFANAIEGAIYSSGQEAVKTIFQDPNQTLGSAATNIGLYGLLGGGLTGAAFAGAGELWNAKFGKQVAGSIEELNNYIKQEGKIANQDAVVNTVQNIVDTGSVPATELKVPTEEAQPVETPKIGTEFQISGEKPNATDIKQAANRLGVEPPEGTFDKDPIVGQKASVIADTDTWEGNQLRKQQLEANNKLQKIADEDLLKDRSASKTEAYDVGKESKEDILSFFTKLRDGLSERYDKVMKHFNVINLTSEIKGRVFSSIESNSFIKTLPNDSEAKKIVTGILEKFNENVNTLGELKEFNTKQINDAIIENQNKGNYQIVNALKELKKVFKVTRADGIRNAAIEIAGREGQAIANEFVKEIETLDKDYASYKKQIVEFLKETTLDKNEYKGDLNHLINKLDKMEPEDIGKKLLNVKYRDQVLYLKENFPKAFELLRKFKIKEIFEKAQSNARGSGNKLNITTILDELDKMGPTMTNLILPDKAQLISDLKLLHTEIPQVFNPPKTAAAGSYLGYFGKKLSEAKDLSGITKVVLEELGSFGKSFAIKKANTIANLIKAGGGDKAADVGVAKVLTSMDKPANATAFKTMVEYIRQSLKGESNTSKAIDALIKGAPVIIPQNLKPDDKIKEKLDKKVKEFNNNSNAMMDLHQDFNHYMGDHGMAIAAASVNAVNYLNTLRPIERKESPLDDPTPPTLIEKQNYDTALTIAQQPLMILQDIKDGTLNSLKLGHLQNLYPDFYTGMKSKIMTQIVDQTEKGIKIPYQTRLGLSLFLGTPLDSTMKPEGIIALQPKMAQAQQQMPIMPQAGGRQKGSMKNINKLADQQLTPTQTRIMEKQSVKV